MRQRHLLFAMFAVAVLLLGMTGCGMTGNPVSDDPDPVDVSALEKELVGLWWDEYEYADVTETGVPFTRVLLAVKADADHTGCIYLGVFNGKSDVPLAVYGGPEDAGFTWKLLADGRILLGDPVTGETYALSRTRGGDGSYGDGMTDVSGTTLTYTDGSVTATNANYSGTLTKADPEQQAEIEEQLAVKATDTPLTVEALTDGTVKVDIERASGPLSTGMKYAVNGGEKTLITTSTDIPVSAGDKVQFYGNGTATQHYGLDPDVRIQGSGEGFTCKVYGNIMSLLDEENFATKTDLPRPNYVFGTLFLGNTALTDASGLLLPATPLKYGCYFYMFSGCTSLTKAPTLSATSLDSQCYWGMFEGCTSLTTAPELPATTIARECYYQMFSGCTSLTTAPELPATTIAPRCYEEMFSGCTSLTTAPELPATAMASSCYEEMFSGCTSLTTAPELPATALNYSCYYGMFRGCTSLTTAPELPATTLTERCYQKMFRGCTNLNSVKSLATSGFNENKCTDEWLNGVAATGTFYLASGAETAWPDGGNGIPSGWTVRYHNGARLLSLITDEYVGKVFGADGFIYDTKSDATKAGTTAVAVIAYVGSDTGDATYNHGLAIKLSDENNELTLSDAKYICEDQSPVPGAKWCLPSKNQWENMCKRDVYYMWTDLNTTIIRAGGTGFRDRGQYWLSDVDIAGYGYYAHLYRGGIVMFPTGPSDVKRRVRAVLVF